MKPGSHLTWEDLSANHGAMEGMVAAVMRQFGDPTVCGMSEESEFGWSHGW
jgi:hypothetical protein